jgi:DHA1 family tetracycline resistance protein-like MFS transporter
LERKLTAILCADVYGYSRLMGQDEEATLRTLSTHRKFVDSLIEKHRGRFVNSAGDSVLAEFASVVNAIQCAVEIQATLRAENADVPPERRMQFRIGVNLGDVMVEGEQIYGDGVNVAARLESLAEPGGICISGTVHEQVRDKLALVFADYVVMAVALTVWWLFAGRVVSGITSASFSTASAYIADVAPPDRRAGSYGMISAAFGLGFVLGPALGGVFGNINPRLPFWIAAGLSLLNAMYGLFVLPESLPRDRREAFNCRRANPMGSIKLLRSHMELLGLSSVSFLTSIAHEALPTTFVLYATYRYGWNERLVGLAIATVGVCSAVVGAGMMQPLVSRLGDRLVMLSGMLFNFAGFVVYGLAPSGVLFWTGIPVGCLGGLSNPPMQSLMTRRVKATEQGQLQGALSSIRGIAFMIGPIIFTSTFASFIGPCRYCHLPGAPYLLAGVIVMLSTIIAWRATSLGAEREIKTSPQPAHVVE